MMGTGDEVRPPHESMRDFEEFFERMSPKLVARAYGLCGNMQDAEDVVQEAFAAVLPQWERYSRYETPEAVVHRAMCQRIWKLRRRHTRWLKRIADVPRPCPRPDPQLSVETREVLSALRELPLRQRTVVDLHVDEFSAQEIADKLGISVKTVRVHLFKARASLREICGRTEEREGRPGLLPTAVGPALGVLPLNMDEGEDEEAVAAVRRAEEELLRHFEADRATRSRILAALREVAVRQSWSVAGVA